MPFSLDLIGPLVYVQVIRFTLDLMTISYNLFVFFFFFFLTSQVAVIV